MADKKDFCAPYKKLIDALIDKHALEVTAHDLSEVSGFADIFIVAIARSELHGRTLKDTAMDTLDEMGFSHENVYTTLEKRMKCGIGICGRCGIGGKYVCLDGPVFSQKELDELPPEL